MSIGNHWNHIHNPTETGEEGKLPDFYRIFSDDMIQGKEYTLNVYIRYDNYANSPLRRLCKTMGKGRNTYAFGKTVSKSAITGAGIRYDGRCLFRTGQNLYQHAGWIWHTGRL